MNSRKKRVHSDNTIEFLVSQEEFWQKGIVLNTSSPYSLQSNGRSERMNHILPENVRFISKVLGLDQRYWGRAVKQAAYSHSKTTEITVQMRIAYEMLFGKLANNAIIGKLGCAVYLYEQRAKRNRKLREYAELGINVGNSDGLFGVHAWQTNRMI